MRDVVSEATGRLIAVDGFRLPLRVEVRASNKVRVVYEIGTTGARQIVSTIGEDGLVAPFEIRVSDREGRYSRAMLTPVDTASLN
jgi:hypothetical protein